MSDQWPVRRLDEVCQKITDGTHHSPKNLEHGDYKYITAKNIKTSGLSLQNVTFVSAADHAEIFGRCPVEQGDVLYIKDGVTTGVAAINHLAEPFSLLSSVALLKPKRDVLEGRYLKHWLNSPQTLAKMTADMTGSAIKRLVLKQIRAAALPMAPLNEQRRIADKLDAILVSVDACRDRLDRVPAILKKFKRSVLAQATRGLLTSSWRGDVVTDQGEGLPNTWRLSQIRDVGKIGSGSVSRPTCNRRCGNLT